jgi:FkbM family methyltransferase
MTRLINKLASIFGAVVMRISTMQRLRRIESESRGYRIYRTLLPLFPNLNRQIIMELLEHSKSQNYQELMAYLVAGKNTGETGFYVEFGATDGLSLSNSFMLETSLSWNGILAEPGRQWHSALHSNRKAVILHSAVYSKSSLELEFLEDGELSTLRAYKGSDHHVRSDKVTYQVPTISLLDLLESNEAPAHVDFLSIDTEGSELEILKHMDFSKFSFGFIAVEHNFSETRQGIHSLLRDKGYVRIFKSESLWDDWFVPKAIADKILGVVRDLDFAL